MSVTVAGIDESIAAINKIVREKRTEAKRQVKAAGILVLNEVIISIMRGQKTGKNYKIGGIVHRASAAGEAPATDTGGLAGSFVSVTADKGYSAIVGSSGEYGKISKYLEFGTPTIQPRPHLFPALEMHRTKIKQMFKDAIK